jgi:hypothetical protein
MKESTLCWRTMRARSQRSPGRADEKLTAFAIEQDFATARGEEWHCMGHVAFKGLRAANRRWRGKVWMRRIVGKVAQPQQIEHHDIADDAAHEECAPGVLRGFEISGHCLLRERQPLRVRADVGGR